MGWRKTDHRRGSKTSARVRWRTSACLPTSISTMISCLQMMLVGQRRLQNLCPAPNRSSSRNGSRLPPGVCRARSASPVIPSLGAVFRRRSRPSAARSSKRCCVTKPASGCWVTGSWLRAYGPSQAKEIGCPTSPRSHPAADRTIRQRALCWLRCSCGRNRSSGQDAPWCWPMSALIGALPMARRLGPKANLKDYEIWKRCTN